MTREIGLVSCVKTKQETPAVPKDLYTSSYFSKMRSYAEKYHDEWFILSAKHGLINPEGDPIDPYDFTLRDVSREERREWAQQVFEELEERKLLDEGTTLVIYAGKAYYQELLPLLEETAVMIEIAAEGLRFGETQAWYKERL